MNDADYKYCKLIRRPNTDWYHSEDSDWGHTGSMPVNNVYLYRYWFNGVSGEWSHTLPDDLILSPYRTDLGTYASLKSTLSASSIEAEEYTICPAAAGDLISLHCKINAARTDYEETDVWQHAWYCSVDNGATWESLDGYAGCIRNFDEGARTLAPLLPDPLPATVCYYLYSKVASGQRLIKFTTDDTGCDYDCSITSVERAISNVNAEDNTYSLDGLVAFGVANGDLKIVYGKGKEGEQTLTISSPVSPQSFSFTGLPAVESSGETRTLEAYFTGNPSGCTRNFVDVPVPNVRDARTEHPTIHLLTGTSATLTPDDAELSNKAVWTDAAGVAHNVAAGGIKTCSTMPSDTAGTHYYVYKELYPLVGSTADMMSNGDYEADAGYGVVDGVSTMSAYTFWGRFDNAAAYSEFYTGAHENANNGFAVIRHAKNFHDKYATLTAKHGSYFGLFDAASDGVAGKKAWYANTSSNNDLKLKKGTTYVFSFWAANINNYGEMDNAAVLQFQIEYGGNTYLLGDPLDLGSAEFQNNIWHQCSSTFTATEDADDVTISVVNLNTDRLRVGNDFALDDIQFHAISTVTETSKSYQIFRVDFHIPTISSFTATPVQMGCGEMTYAVDLNIQYRNQPGKLKVVDITGGGSRDVWDTTLVALPGAGAGATWDELKEINRRVVQTIISGDPVGKKRTYKVYFEDWTTATLSADFNDPVIPVLTATNDNNPAAILPCDQLTYTLNVNVSYRNMSADKIQVWVDGASYATSSLKQEKSIDKNTSATKTVSFAIDNVPADSAEHVLHVECAGLGEGCFDPLTFRAPFAPKVVEPIVVIAPAVSCSSPTYTATVNVTTTNHRNATLTAFVNQGTPISKVVVGDVTEFVFDDLKADGSEDTVTVYFDYVHASQPECDKTHKYTAPTQPRASLVTPITMPSVAACDQQTFDLTISVKFTNQDGDLQLKADDGSWKTFYTASTTAGEGKYLKNSTEQTKSVTLTGLPTDGGTAHTIYYRFNAEGYCGYDTPLESAALTFPQSPTVTSTSVFATPATLDCDAANYTRTVTVNYKNGIGKKIVIEDEDGNKLYTSPTTLATSDGSISPSVTLSAIDGASHHVIAYFEGYDCKSELAHKGTYTAPVKPVISDVTVSDVGETKCSPYNYTISGTVTYSNADISKKLIVAYGALKDEITLSSASATVDFTISDMTATGSALTVDAYFKDAPAGCTKTSNTFASPTQPSMDIKNIKQSTPGCDDLTYNLSFDVDYIYQHGNLTVHVDTYGDTVITIPETSRRKKDKLTVHVTYTAKIPADGNTHTLYASFAGEKSCSASQTLAAVLSPVITDLAVTVPTDPIACDATSYPASVAVTTQYAVGKNIVIKYKNASNEDVVLGTHKVLTSPETYTFTPLSFTDIGATGTRSVWAYLAERDTCVKSEDYAIPPTTSIDPFTISTITDKSTCSGVKYDLEGHISYSSMPVGASPAVRFGAYNAAMTNVTSTGADFKFTNVTTTGEGLHVEAYFTDKPECFVSSGTFNAPLKPDVQVINQVMADAACNVMTTTLLFDIVYTKQPAGELKVWLNDTHIGERTLTYTPNAGKEKPDTIHAAVSSIPATGGAYTLHVNFAAGCGDRTFDTPSTKFSPVISDSTAVISGESCGSDAYTVTVTFKVKNGQSKLVTVAGKGLTPQSKTVVDGTNTFTFTNVPRTLAVADDDYFEIYFPDALPSCPHILLEYAETPKPVLTSITPNAAPALDCTDGTYTLTGTVGYTYINAQPYIWLDDKEDLAVPVGTAPGSYSDKSASSASTAFSLTGVPADGQTHTLHLKAAGWTAGCPVSQTFTAALQPVFGTVTAVASDTYLHCNQTYSVVVTIQFVHSGGRTLYVEYTDNGSTTTEEITTVAGDTEKQITLTGLKTIDGAAHDIKVWFDGFKSCMVSPSPTYTAPKLKTITLSDVTSNPVNCGDLSFSISGTVTSNVAGESIVITTNSGKSTTVTSRKDEAVEYTVSGLTAAGNLSAQFVGVPCSVTDEKDFVNVLLKPYPTFDLNDITPQCYPAESFVVTYTHTDAATIKYTVNGGEEIPVAVNAEKEFIIDIHDWTAGTYVIEAYAESAAGCKSSPTSKKNLVINAKPEVTTLSVENICKGAGVAKVNFTAADATQYSYYIVDQTEPSAKKDILDGKFDLTIPTALIAGTYTLRLTAYSATCESNPKDVEFTIYPLPELKFDAIDAVCYPASGVEVEYTAAYTKEFRYTVKTKDGTTTKINNKLVAVDASKKFTLETDGWDAGEYTLTATAVSTSEKGCTADAPSVDFSILPKPKVTSIAMESKCVNTATAQLTFAVEYADEYQYYIVGQTTLSDKKSIASPVDVTISGLLDGEYTLKLVVSSASCVSDTASTEFEIYPLPTFLFNDAVAHDCYPSTGISVGYTSTNASTYSYTLTKEGAGSPALTGDDLHADATGSIALNTEGLSAGKYELKVTAKSVHNCEQATPVTKEVTIYDQPTLTITSVENRCEGGDKITVNYKTEYATDYSYEVVGTGLFGHGLAASSGSFTIDINTLTAKTYTLHMQATATHASLVCEGATADKTFEIYPVPKVEIVTPSPIKEGVSNVTVSLNLTAADTYDWRFMNGATELESGDDVPSSTTTISLTTGTLDEGTYSLFVAPENAHCTGEEKEVHVVVNNKPTINFTEPALVCEKATAISIPYSTSPDATDLYYTNMRGTTPVGSEQHVDLTATASPLSVDISGLSYGTYTLSGYVKSALESGDVSEVNFTLMAVPTVETVTQTKEFIGCDETYDATIVLNIYNAAGKSVYAKYTDDNTEHIVPVTTATGDETATFHLSGLKDTDHGTHYVNVYVDGFEECGGVATYTEPKLMTILPGFEATPAPKSCGDDTFTINGKVCANCNVGNIVVEYDAMHTATVVANTSGSSFTIPSIPAGGSITQLKAYFEGKTCGVVESAAFAEPTQPQASVTYSPIVAPACDVTTFSLDFSLSYTYQQAGTLTVWVDEAHKLVLTSADGDYQALNATAQTLTGTIANLPADGRTGQKLYFKFSGDHSCEGSVDLPAFPQTPLITGVTVTGVPAYVAGESGTYKPTVTVTYEKAVGERIVLEYLDKNDDLQYAYSASTVSGDGTYVFDEASGLPAFDDVTKGSRTVHAYFEGSACTTGGNHDGAYTAPTYCAITFVSVSTVNHSLCDHLLYDITGYVSYVGTSVGDLIVELDAVNRCVIPESQCVAGQPLPFTIQNASVAIPAEGVQLLTYFADLASNTTSYTLVADLVIPELQATLAAVDTVFTCGDKSYTVGVNITSANQSGTGYVLDSIAGGAAVARHTESGTFSGTASFSIARPATAETHYVIVRYPATGCEVVSAPIDINPYIKSEPRISLTAIDRLCDSETELNLPLVITQGDITDAALTVTDSKGQTIVNAAPLVISDSKDTLTYSLAAPLAAGTYTATVEAHDTLDCAATATLPVELALDGHLYSKWTDVLLVDNPDGQFTAYQWYENGLPLASQTAQTLYLPEGMNGTYCCLLTLTDGTQLYTCEQAFAAIPRSADNPGTHAANEVSVTPNRVRMGGNVTVRQSASETLRLLLMSATGQRIAEWVQTDSRGELQMPSVQGVYMLRVTTPTDSRAVKIVVY